MRSISSTRKLISTRAIALLSSVLSCSTIAADSTKFEHSIRVGYVPHSSYKVENGLPSGSLAELLECSTAYFSRVEFIEMSQYSRLMQSLENNVVDIGLNMIRTKSRDQIAQYGFDLYTSRILLVGNEKSSANQGAGVLAVKQGSGVNSLLQVKGYQVSTAAHSIDKLIDTYRQGSINSFAEMEVNIFDYLLELDRDEVDYDYEVLSEYAGGAYIAKDFVSKYPAVINEWQKVAQSCAHLAPKIDP